MIKFEKISEENYSECLQLDPGEKGSKYVAPNVNSLAIAYVCKENNVCSPMPFAIYNDDVMVGFILLSSLKKEQENDVEEDIYDIWRFMVDQKYQGKGYGRQALLKAIEFIKSFPYGPANTLVLSYLSDNEVGSHLYESVGFTATGEIDDGEIVMSLNLTG